MTKNLLYSDNVYDLLQTTDPEILDNLNAELVRQQDQLEMIASENFASLAVIAAAGSFATNKYAEGYPNKRYYNGCEIVDNIEIIAIKRAAQLFNCKYANVQPHSGSQANQGVFLALLQPHDTIMGMSLDSGGHLTHGSTVNLSGKWFNAIGYGVSANENLIDLEQVEKLAIKHSPKLIIAGGSAYSRQINYSEFRRIADQVGAYLMVDMAHFAGLVAGKQVPNPLEYADVVTTTTHKTLRGPRGGMILTNSAEIIKKINSAIFPGLQGGPLMHIIAAKAVALKEALDPSFQEYTKQVIQNAQIFAKTLQANKIDVVSQGTDGHLILVDLRSYNLSGYATANMLELSGLTCNMNSVYNDPRPPRETSGLRFGSPALTTRGMKTKEFIAIAENVARLIKTLSLSKTKQYSKDLLELSKDLCKKFPLYS